MTTPWARFCCFLGVREFPSQTVRISHLAISRQRLGVVPLRCIPHLLGRCGAYIVDRSVIQSDAAPPFIVPLGHAVEALSGEIFKL